MMTAHQRPLSVNILFNCKVVLIRFGCCLNLSRDQRHSGVKFFFGSTNWPIELVLILIDVQLIKFL